MNVYFDILSQYAVWMAAKTRLRNVLPQSRAVGLKTSIHRLSWSVNTAWHLYTVVTGRIDAADGSCLLIHKRSKLVSALWRGDAMHYPSCILVRYCLFYSTSIFFRAFGLGFRYDKVIILGKRIIIKKPQKSIKYPNSWILKPKLEFSNNKFLIIVITLWTIQYQKLNWLIRDIAS